MANNIERKIPQEFTEGYDSYTDGFSLDSNPYERGKENYSPTRKFRWERGWIEAYEESNGTYYIK